MAQKRNPISLRLETRLRGYEKRFTSCWFTDLFFPQAYTNDLIRRLYVGHLLEKGGSWYGERNESLIPETCVSIQFLYRKCSVLSVLLDRRKQEYALLTSSKDVNPKGNFIPSRFDRKQGRSESKNQINDSRSTFVQESFLDLNGESTLSLVDSVVQRRERIDLVPQDNTLSFTIKNRLTPLDRGNTTLNLLEIPFSSEKVVAINEANYLSIAGLFGGVVGLHQSRAFAFLTFLKEMPFFQNNALESLTEGLSTQFTLSSGQVVPRERRMREGTVIESWNHVFSSRHNMSFDLQPVSTIEYLSDFSEREPLIRGAACLTTVYKNSNQQIGDFPSKTKKRGGGVMQFTPAFHWSSLDFVRATSGSQSIEFCLYSVISLYKKRFAFPLIRDIFFRMLAASGIVRGARLVCSGRQGGRSKSAMRAKKQSALWGQSALSLFSSRLAFASTSVYTSFGQIGIKVWICYK